MRNDSPSSLLPSLPRSEKDCKEKRLLRDCNSFVPLRILQEMTMFRLIINIFENRAEC